MLRAGVTSKTQDKGLGYGVFCSCTGTVVNHNNKKIKITNSCERLTNLRKPEYRQKMAKNERQRIIWGV